MISFQGRGFVCVAEILVQAREILHIRPQCLEPDVFGVEFDVVQIMYNIYYAENII